MALYLLLTCMVYIVVIVQSTDEPIIGILTLPCSSTSSWCPSNVNPKATTYLPASYVKWLEGGGARVIPIRADDTFANVHTLLSQINGVLFTGGAASFSSSNIWWNQLNNILSYLRSFSTTSKAIPLWATCLGFQGLVTSTAEQTVNTAKQAEDEALPITFSPNAAKSRIFNTTMNYEYSSMVYNILKTEKVTMNFHNYGIDPSLFTNIPSLNGNFSVLATSNDVNGEPFVTLIQSLDSLNLYWYGSQFHPEKVQYIFDMDNGNNNINHNLDAIVSNQYFAEFFVNECRLRNTNTMNKNEYNSQVIYNDNPYFMYNGTKTYEQVYLFTKPTITH